MSRKGKFTEAEVPESVLRLATNFPEKSILSPINMSYSGGCLATSHYEEENYVLLHPTGEKLNRLAFTHIKKSKGSNQHFKSTSNENNTIKIKGGHILQISKAIDGYCFVRQKSSCTFVNFNDPNEVTKTRVVKNCNLMSISASPYNPLDYIMIHSQGGLEFRNLELSEPICLLDRHKFTCPISVIDTIQCSFGSHPQSILCLNEKYLYSFDMRYKDYRQRNIFSSDYSSCFVDEQLISCKNCALSDFQHVVSSTHHMFVCDERYPKRPVLIYNHMLKGHPLYCDKTVLKASDNQSDVLIVIGTQDTNQLSSFAIRAHDTLIQPCSLSPPMHLSSPKDCGETVKLHGIPVEESIMQRLAYPLIGISVLSHSQGSGFTTFQLNSLGDLFYQDFQEDFFSDSEKSRNIEMGCVLTPLDRIQPHFAQFLPAKNDTTDPVEFNHPKSIEINVNLVEIFDAMKNIPDFCETCNPDENVSRSEHESTLKVVCPSCNFDDRQSQNLKDSLNNMELLTGPIKEVPNLEEFNITSLYDFSDPLSKKLLDAWNFVDEDSSPGACYHDSDLSFATSTPQSSSSISDPHQSVNESNASHTSEMNDDIVKRLFENISSINATDLPITVDQELMEDIVPPSQEIRPRVGETLRASKKFKSSLGNSRTGNAGFL